jgi:hypothetical protein
MRVYAGMAAAVGWFGLILQLVLLLTGDSELSVGMRLVNFFSYFTIISNLLSAIVLTVAALGGRGGAIGFFARPGVIAGVAIYMTVTFIIYWTILSSLWAPEGWDYVANLVLHGIMPVLLVGHWLLFVGKGALTFRRVPWFLAFPVGYAIYTLIRGPVVDWYPYPFIDASALTTSELIVNIVAVTAGFLVLGVIYVLLDRWLARMRAGAAVS